METKALKYAANVQFTGEHFVLTTNVIVDVDGDENLFDSDIEERAVTVAAELLEEYYGWSIEWLSNDISVNLSTPF